MSSPSFAVLIPMYNEAAGAEACVHAVCRELATLPNRSALIAVDDGSTDGTAAILARLAAEHPQLNVATHPVNQGYGSALRTGIQRADSGHFDYVLFMDSDLTNSPADISKFLEPMGRGVDVIKASRYLSGGRMEGVPLARALLSRAGNAVARLLFRSGVRDCTNGFRAVRISFLRRMNLREPGFATILEELYQAEALAGTFAEVPVVLSARRNELRPTSFPYRPATFVKYLKYALLAALKIPPRVAPGQQGTDPSL